MKKWILVYYWNGKVEGEDVYYDKKRAYEAYTEALADNADSDENVSVRMLEDYGDGFYDEADEAYESADYYNQRYKEGD